MLEIHMFVFRKHTHGETNARLIGGGNKHQQQDYLTKDNSSLPTVATKSVLLTLIVDAAEKRDFTIINMSNAFIQTRVDQKKDLVIIQIQGVVAECLTKIAPEVDSQYVTSDRKGDKMLLVECMNEIYSTMVAGLLYNHKFMESLDHKKFPRICMTGVYGTRSSRESSVQSVSVLMTAISFMNNQRLLIIQLHGCVKSTRVS